MEAFKHALLKTIKGERKINERRKYVVTGIVLSLVHFYLMCLFLVNNIKILYMYNFFAVLFYTCIAIITARVFRYTYIFAASFIEILLHSILASLLLGWNWGFMTYTLGLIPTSFYIAYTVDFFKKKLTVPAIASGTVFACFLMVRQFTSRHDAFLNRVFPDSLINGVYVFNMMLTFAFLWIVAYLFSLEVYYMQHNLESENYSLEQMAHFDPLTQLLNRRSMDTCLEEACFRAVRKNEGFCIILADIDDFKKVNDTYGHAAGDRVLIEVAGIIGEEVRDNDRVCRWGGEEIVVLIRSDLDKAKRVAWRICREVSEREIDIGNEKLKVTMTLGIACYHEGDTIDDIISRADKYMYEGKLKGKNRVVCEK